MKKSKAQQLDMTLEEYIALAKEHERIQLSQ